MLRQAETMHGRCLSPSNQDLRTIWMLRQAETRHARFPSPSKQDLKTRAPPGAGGNLFLHRFSKPPLRAAPLAPPVGPVSPGSPRCSSKGPRGPLKPIWVCKLRSAAFQITTPHPNSNRLHCRRPSCSSCSSWQRSGNCSSSTSCSKKKPARARARPQLLPQTTRDLDPANSVPYLGLGFRRSTTPTVHWLQARDGQAPHQ